MTKSLQKKVIPVKTFSELEELDFETWVELKDGSKELKVDIGEIDSSLIPQGIYTLEEKSHEHIQVKEIYPNYPILSWEYKRGTEKYNKCKEILDRNKLE
jgi:hypothetical protein